MRRIHEKWLNGKDIPGRIRHCVSSGCRIPFIQAYLPMADNRGHAGNSIFAFLYGFTIWHSCFNPGLLAVSKKVKCHL